MSAYSREPGQALPVVVLAGYLGAGKTTIFNYLLSQLDGVKVGAVVNDFGDIAVDALSIEAHVDDMVTLSNGCICCELDVEDMENQLTRLAEPERGLDLLVIEASGLADPIALTRMVGACPTSVISCAGMLYVVDAVNWFDVVTQRPSLYKHVNQADMIVLSKCDLTPADVATAVISDLEGAGIRRPVLPISSGKVPLDLLLGSTLVEPSVIGCDEADCAHDQHIHHNFQAHSVRWEGPVHPRDFHNAIAQLPQGVFRFKGFVHLASTDTTYTYNVQGVGRRLELHPLHQPITDNGLVVIGSGITPLQLSELRNCRIVHSPANEVTFQDSIVMHRFIVAAESTQEPESWLYDEERSAPTMSGWAGLQDPEDPESCDPAFTP